MINGEIKMQEANTPNNDTRSDRRIRRGIDPVEPVFTILLGAPVTALQAMLVDINDYTHISELDDFYQSIGLTRLEMLEQIKLVVDSRALNIWIGEQLTIFDA